MFFFYIKNGFEKNDGFIVCFFSVNLWLLLAPMKDTLWI